MMIRTRPLIACFVMVAVLMGATPALAQDFSPYLEKTGRGAFDLYRDTVLCGAVLERAVETMPDSADRPLLDKGVRYTANFALFLLESGNVVDAGRTILTPADLAPARDAARASWLATLVALAHKGEAPDAEIGRCLRLYGHDWK